MDTVGTNRGIGSTSKRAELLFAPLERGTRLSESQSRNLVEKELWPDLEGTVRSLWDGVPLNDWQGMKLPTVKIEERRKPLRLVVDVDWMEGRLVDFLFVGFQGDGL